MLTKIWSEVCDLFFPRRCVMCEERLDVDEWHVCKACLAELPRTEYHLCPEDNPMAQLFWGLVPVERATAWFFYAPGTRTSQIVYELKYHGQPDIGYTFGRVMSSEMKESGFFDGIDLIVPVPLTPERQRQRGYNQSLLIAQGISRETGISIAEHLVERLHFRESQTHLDRWERLKNVEKQFRADLPPELDGKHLLLVDDVTTTGATLIACAQAMHPKEHHLRFSFLTLGYTHS